MIELGSDNHPVWQLHLDLAWRPVTFCIATFLPDFPLRLCKAAFLVTFQDKQFRLISTSVIWSKYVSPQGNKLMAE